MKGKAKKTGEITAIIIAIGTLIALAHTYSITLTAGADHTTIHINKHGEGAIELIGFIFSIIMLTNMLIQKVQTARGKGLKANSTLSSPLPSNKKMREVNKMNIMEMLDKQIKLEKENEKMRKTIRKNTQAIKHA